MANILITGGAGYIGSVLTQELLDHGHQVTVVDNFIYGQTSLNHLCSRRGFQVHKQDVRNVASLRPLLSRADIVIPLAAIVGAPACERDPYTASSTNKIAVFDMLDLVSQDQLVIMPTTNSAYGQGQADHYCNEDSPLNPISLYAKEKVEVESRLMQHASAVSLRLATVFGMSARMRLDLLVNDFVWRAVQDNFVVLFEAHFRRNYIHVRDVAAAFLLCINGAKQMTHRIYNVGLSDANISKLDLCRKIHSHIPQFRYYIDDINRDPDQRNYIVDNSRIEQMGFQASIGLDAGISELIKGYVMLQNNKFTNLR